MSCLFKCCPKNKLRKGQSSVHLEIEFIKVIDNRIYLLKKSLMLATERHRNIISSLKTEGRVRVIELAQKFNVTEETIRRDLEKLEKNNQLVRSHGGAVPNENISKDSSFDERLIKNIDSKKSIAKMAAEEILEGDCIFLDGSTTAWQIARYLHDIPLTLLTNSFKVLVELMEYKNINLISIGGEYCTSSKSFMGPQSIKFMQDCYVDKLFFSCQSLDLNWGLSDSNPNTAELKRTMIEQSNKKYLLVDSTKFGSRSYSRITSLDSIDSVFTDKNCPSESIDFLTNKNIKTHVSMEDAS